MSDAVRAQTSGDELVKLIGYVARMPDAELAVLKETDSSEFIAQFVRQQAAGMLLAMMKVCKLEFDKNWMTHRKNPCQLTTAPLCVSSARTHSVSVIYNDT